MGQAWAVGQASALGLPPVTWLTPDTALCASNPPPFGLVVLSQLPTLSVGPLGC